MPTLDITLPRERNSTPVHDPLSMYKISDRDYGNDPQYEGFLAHNESFYIMKWNLAGDTFRYYAGKGLADYLSKWADRASLPYDHFSDIF